MPSSRESSHSPSADQGGEAQTQHASVPAAQGHLHSRHSSMSSTDRSTRGSPPISLRPAPAIYTEDELNLLQDRNEDSVTRRHLECALDHVVQVLETSGIKYGIMGGMSLILMGYRGRATTDVDVAVQPTGSNRVKDLLAAFSGDDRAYLPRAMAVAGTGVARLFILTGPNYGETVQPLAVEVDLILNGSLGAPPTLTAEEDTVTLECETAAGPRNWKIISLLHLFRAKLRAFYTRDATKDYGDLVWMCVKQSQAVRGFAAAGRLDAGMKQHFATECIDRETNPAIVTHVHEVLGLRMPSYPASRQGSARSSSQNSARSSNNGSHGSNN